MALNDYEGELIVVGWFLYDRTVPTRVEIVARNYDVYYQVNAADDLLELRARPAPLGADGRLYYLKGNLEPHPTLEAAQAWADRQPWGPVDWNVPEPLLAEPVTGGVAHHF